MINNVMTSLYRDLAYVAFLPIETVPQISLLFTVAVAVISTSLMGGRSIHVALKLSKHFTASCVLIA